MVNNEMTARSLASRAHANVFVSAALIALFVALMAVAAWIRIPVGPVPVTLQTLVVFVAAAVLGSRRSTIAMVAYVGLGCAGLPLFSGFAGGAAAITGFTGGYLVGFALMTLICGAMIERFGRSVPVLLGAMAAGLLVCYAFGTAWFMIAAGTSDLAYVLSLCVTPFLLADALKIALAISIVKVLGVVSKARS